VGASAPRARTDPEICEETRPRPPNDALPVRPRAFFQEPHGVGRAKRIRWSPCPRVLARKQHYSWCGAVTWCRRRCHQESAPAVKASGQGSGEKKPYTARAEFCQQDHGPGEGNFLSIVPPLKMSLQVTQAGRTSDGINWPLYLVHRQFIRSLFPRTGDCPTTWAPQLHNKPKNEIILNHFASAIAIYDYMPLSKDDKQVY
jgi:hypothetical protein